MCKGQDKDQYADIAGNADDEHFGIYNHRPETKLDKSVPDIEEMVSNQQDLVQIIRRQLVILKQGQNKYSAIQVKKFSHIYDNEDRKDQINDVCGYIIIHTIYCMRTILVKQTFSKPSATIHPGEKEIVYQPVYQFAG